MRLRLSIRTFLILIALLGLVLAHLVSVWNEGGFAFQKWHAERARSEQDKAGESWSHIAFLKQHAAPDHLC